MTVKPKFSLVFLKSFHSRLTFSFSFCRHKSVLNLQLKPRSSEHRAAMTAVFTQTGIERVLKLPQQLFVRLLPGN